MNGWIEDLHRALSWSRRGILLLVDEAQDASLGRLVRHLVGEWPGLSVLEDVARLPGLEPGSTVILAPPPAAAGWLNTQRPLFQQASLRVVVWARPGVADALSRDAPDYFDWISVRVTCPPQPPPFAIADLRAAADLPGIVWRGEGFAASLQAAGDVAGVSAVDASQPLDQIAAAIRLIDEPAGWLTVTGVDSRYRLRRLRWLLAALGRHRRVALLDPQVPVPGWWFLSPATLPIAEACARLATAGAGAPGRLAALADLEPGVIEDLCARLRSGQAEAELGARLLSDPDGGAALAAASLAGALPLPGDSAPHLLRAHQRDPGRVDALRRMLLGISRRVQAGEPVPEAELAFWASYSAETVAPRGPHADLDPAWLVEAVLRSAPRASADFAWAVGQVTRLGDPEAARWLGSAAPARQASSPSPFSPATPCFYVPFGPKGAGMVGHQAALAKVRQKLESGRRTLIGQAAAFVGLGGIGKTQLAVEYAHAFRDRYPNGVYWFNADGDLEAQLILLCERARWVDPRAEHATKLTVARQRVQTGTDCLLIFDNVLRVEDFRHLLPPPGGNTHVLVTSRSPQPGFLDIPLDLLGPDDALDLLERESDAPIPPGPEREAAACVAALLDGLPLALELVAAHQRRCTIGWPALARRLSEEQAAVARLAPLGFAQESLTGHEANLMAALRLDDALLAAHAALRQVIDLLAHSAPAAMGWDLLRRLLPEVPADLLEDDLAFGCHLRILQREQGGACAGGPDGARHRIHRLVREVWLAAPPAETAPADLDLQLTLLGDWFMAQRLDFALLPRFEAEVDHLVAWQRYAERRRAWGSWVQLEWLRAYPPWHRGAYAASERHLDGALEVFRRERVDDRALEAHLWNDKGVVGQGQGRDLGEVIGWFRRVLELRRAVLGEDHTDTALSFSNLGAALGDQGETGEALVLARRAVQIREAVLGGRHPDTALSLRVLAVVLARGGSAEEGLRAADRAIIILRHALGPDHPELAQALDARSRALVKLKRLREAIDALRQGLAILRRAHGESHPTFAQFLFNLALLHKGNRDMPEALAHAREAHTIRRATLPEHHPRTLDSVQQVADLLLTMERPAEAAALLTSALTDLPTGHRRHAALAHLARSAATERDRQAAEHRKIEKRRRARKR